MTKTHKRKALELCSLLFSVFCFSFLFNFFWEALHAVYLYHRHDFDAAHYVPMLLYVSSMDGLIVLGLYLFVSVLWLNLFWIKLFLKRQILVFILSGIVVATITEYLSVFYYHRWSYKEIMPTIFGIGISPLVQLSLTGFIGVWLTRELLYGKGLCRN
ncbi:MAG: hypothetical protein WAM61_21980 [Desulfobacterales bacterium]